jgi:hypothetical protein
VSLRLNTNNGGKKSCLRVFVALSSTAFTPGGQTNKMKIVTLALALFITVGMYGQADFSGKWKLNSKKSEFNDTPGAPAAGMLVVEQKGSTLTLQRDERRRESLTIDSTASIDIEESDHTTKVNMKLAADKKGLIETRTYTYPESETAEVAAKKTRTWTLSSDKKTLTITDNIESTQGNVYVMVLVYEKQ